MQLDFTQFLSKLEKLSPIPVKSLPDREYVEMYVKAYYMPDTVMEEWIQQHAVRKSFEFSKWLLLVLKRSY